MMDVAVGDWIRFMNDGQLVIDEVAYIVPRSRFDSTPEAMTVAYGQVSFGNIVEMRKESMADEPTPAEATPMTPPTLREAIRAELQQRQDERRAARPIQKSRKRA